MDLLASFDCVLTWNRCYVRASKEHLDYSQYINRSELSLNKAINSTIYIENSSDRSCDTINLCSDPSNSYQEGIGYARRLKSHAVQPQTGILRHVQASSSTRSFPFTLQHRYPKTWQIFDKRVIAATARS